MGWLLALLPLVPPLMPAVRWPVAAKVVPKLQEIGTSLYTGAWWLGVAEGFGWGMTVGIPIGVVSTVAVATLIYWGWLKPIHKRKRHASV